MNKRKYSDGDIANILKRAEQGVSILVLCEEAGISRATFYNWRNQFSIQQYDHTDDRLIIEENNRLKETIHLLREEMHVLLASLKGRKCR